jgi:peptide/nickel transport system substrate-binding protein
MKRLAAWLGLAVAAGLLVSPAEAQTRGGSLTFARQADCLYLDPVHIQINADIWMALNIYDMLILPTLDGKGLKPGLATDYKLADDGKSVTLHLRPDIKFGDGSPITLEDVKWSLERAANPDTGGTFQFLLGSVDHVEVTPPDTIIVHLKHPDPAIVHALATFNASIVPKHLIEAAPGKDLEEKSKAFAEHPIGSGPFMVKSWTHNSEMVLVRNPYYWQKAADGKPLPYLDEIHFPIIPDDATRVLKLKAGEIDATEFVPLSRVQEMKSDPNLNMILFPSEKVIYLNLNNRAKLPDGRKNPMADARVRQALNYATDKDALIQVLTYGVGTLSKSVMPMSTPLAYGETAPYLVDPDKAKQLLTEAGYPNGFEITAEVVAGNADDIAELSAVQQMWAQVGVTMKIQQLENAARTADENAGKFEMETQLWTNDIDDPNEITSYFMIPATSDSNHTGFDDKDIEKWFDASQSEIDTTKRAELYKKIQQKYAADAPIVFLLEIPYPIAARKEVKGFVQIPLGDNIFVETSKEPK